MEELRKTVYLRKDQFEVLMENTRSSFTKRIIDLAFIGLVAEDIVHEVEKEVFFSEEHDCTVEERVKELVNKGYLYEKEKEPKIDFTIALKYLNTIYKKKHPDKPLPCD